MPDRYAGPPAAPGFRFADPGYEGRTTNENAEYCKPRAVTRGLDGISAS
jgi:hypothetical protein